MSEQQTLDLQGWPTWQRDAIGAAIDLGWTASLDSKGHTAFLRSYDGGQEIRIHPVRSMNEAKRKAVERKIVRYGDPMKQVTMLARERAVGDSDKAAQYVATVPHAAEAVITGKVTTPVEEPVAVRPWLARKAAKSAQGQGAKYESGAVLERVWGGSRPIDYACAFEGCDYVSNRARSVSAHFRVHVRRGEAAPVSDRAKALVVVPTWEPETTHAYSPRASRVAALAEYLADQMLDGADLTNISRAALIWQHEQEGHSESEQEPLTAEDILDRVRALVGAPLASRLTELENEVVDLMSEVGEALAGRKRAEDRWAALKSIVDDEGEA